MSRMKFLFGIGFFMYKDAINSLDKSSYNFSILSMEKNFHLPQILF